MNSHFNDAAYRKYIPPKQLQWHDTKEKHENRRKELWIPLAITRCGGAPRFHVENTFEMN